jgi:hypothetical protein
MINESQIKAIGHVNCTFEYKNGKKYEMSFPNTVLVGGREALAAMLTNTLGTCPSTNSSTNTNLVPSLYISNMLFGNNGVDSVTNTPKIVAPTMTSLFGPSVATKPVNSYTNQTVTTQAIFTTTLLFDDAVNIYLSEMALQMSNGVLYSMVTFPSIFKTDQTQITFNWTLNFV